METKMDFSALARRDLQTLCKKNQIPANQTNVAMADALASLEHVEGLHEFLNQPKHDEMQSAGKEKPLAEVITRSMTRMSTRRKAALESETEQLPSHTTARRSIRNRNTAAANNDRKVLDFAETPAALRTKKRSEPASVQRKVEKEKAEDVKNEEEDATANMTVKTGVKTRLGKAQASITQSTRMSTRRSTRLLEKKMNDLKLTDDVAKDLEPIKMGDLAEEKNLPEESEYVTKDDHPSENAEEEAEAEVIASEVETLAEVETENEAEGESQSLKICEKSETAQSEVNATPVTDESQRTEFTEDADAEKEVNSEDVADVVEALAEVVTEMEAEIERSSTEIYGKKETTAVEVETDCKNQDSLMLANMADEKFDEAEDDSSAGQLQEGLISVEEAADGHGDVELGGNAAPTDGDDISELTAQVTSWNLDSSKEVCNKEMDALVVITDMGDNDDVVLDGYLADNDGVSESNAKVESSVKIGELFDVTEAEALELPEIEKLAETFDMKIIEGAPEAGKDSSAGCKKTPASLSKTNRVPLSPLSASRPIEVLTPLKSSSKKMQPKDENKENVGNGAEFGKQKKNITEPVLAAEEDNLAPTSLQDKSIRELRKIIREKTKMQNEKRPALQTLPGNNNSAVAGYKDV